MAALKRTEIAIEETPNQLDFTSGHQAGWIEDATGPVMVAGETRDSILHADNSGIVRNNLLGRRHWTQTAAGELELQDVRARSPRLLTI